MQIRDCGATTAYLGHFGAWEDLPLGANLLKQCIGAFVVAPAVRRACGTHVPRVLQQAQRRFVPSHVSASRLRDMPITHPTARTHVGCRRVWGGA